MVSRVARESASRASFKSPSARLRSVMSSMMAGMPLSELLESRAPAALARTRISVAKGGSSALPLPNLSAKKPVSPLKLSRARRRERQRHPLPDRDRRADGEQSRNRLDAAIDPVVRKPKSPDAHEMRRAAGKDKETCQHENGGK